MSQSKLLRIFNNNGEIDQELYDFAHYENTSLSLKDVTNLFKQAYCSRIEKFLYPDLNSIEGLNTMEIENKVRDAFNKCVDSQTSLKNISGFYRKEDA